MNIRYYLRDNGRVMTSALAHKILKFPHVTDKTSKIAHNKYMTFVVDTKYNKCDIKKACKIIFDHEVEKVNVINKKQRLRSFRGKLYRNSTFKKAMVMFKDGGLMEEIVGGVK